MATNVQRSELEFSSRGAPRVRQDLDLLDTSYERTRQKLERGITTSRSATNTNARLAESFRNTARSVAVLEGPLGPLAGRLSAVSSSLTLMNPLVAGTTITLAALTGGMAAAVAKTSAWEQSTFKITQLLETTDGASGRTAAQIERLSQEIGKATLASTNGVREAAAQLLTFRSISGDVFDDTLRLSQDLAALGFGSITSATQTLAKALEDPAEGLTRLRRIGVSFTEAQREMIKEMVAAGDQAGAQATILAILEKQVGGAGVAEAGGLAGAFDTLTERVGLFLERVGRDTGVVDRMTGALHSMADAVAGLDKATGGKAVGETLSEKIEELARLRAAQSTAENLSGRRLGPAPFRASPSRRELGLDVSASSVDEIERQIQALREKARAEAMAAIAAEKHAAAQKEAAAAELAAERQATVDAFLESLGRETELLRMGKAEREQIAAADRAVTAARREAKVLTDAQVAAIRERAIAEKAAQQAITDSWKAEDEKAKATEKAQQAIEQTIAKLTAETEAQERLAAAHAVGAEKIAEVTELNEFLAETQKHGADLTRDQEDKLADLIRRRGEAVRQIKAMNDEEKERNKLMEEGRRLTERLRTPAEVLADTQARLNRLHREGAIDLETYNRALAGAQDEFRKAAREADTFGNTLNGIAKTVIGGLINTAISGGGDFDIGGIVRGIGSRVIGDVLDKGLDSILNGGLGALSGNPLDLLTSAGGTLNQAVSAVIGPNGQIIPLTNGLQTAANGIATSSLGQTFGLANGYGGSTAAQAALVTGPELGISATPAGANFAASIGQFGSLAVSPILGMMVGAIVSAIANSGDDGPAFGARLGVNEAGLLDIAAANTDDGFSSETAQRLAELVQTLSNSFLGSAGLTLRDGAFRGELAYNERRFKASANAADNAAYGLSTGLDVTGILGLNRDSRHFDNVNQAVADFVSRNLFLAVQEGAVEGLSGNQSDAFHVGLGNIIRQVRDDVTGREDGLDVFTRRLDALTSFARFRETLDSVAVSADDAAARLAAAAESQDAYSKALETVREEAKAAAVSGLAGLGDFVDDMHRLFDPTGGASTQIRLRLTNGADSIITNGGLRGGLDVVNASVIDRFFDSDNGVDPARAAAGFKANRLALLKRFEAFGVGFTNTGLDHVNEGGAFGEHGQPNVFTSDGGSVRFNQPGVGGGYNLTIDARQLVQALTGSDGLDFGDAILDPLFAKGVELLADSFRVGQARVDEYFETLTGESGLQGPARLIEELVPTVSPLVQSFENLKAQIEATRPDIEALNEDFKRFGVSVVDVDGKIAGAIETVRRNAQDQFLAGLGITIDGNNQVQTGVNVAGITALAQAIKDQEATAGTLFETDSRGVMPQIMAAIRDQMMSGIQNLLSGATNKEATRALIEQVFGDRLSNADLTRIATEASDGLKAFTAEIQAATNAMVSQISALES